MEFSRSLGDKYYLFISQRIMGTSDRLLSRVLGVATAKFYLNISEKNTTEMYHNIQVSRKCPGYFQKLCKFSFKT